MAHRPVGTGISLVTGASSGMTTSFNVQTDAVRVVSVTADAFVEVGGSPTAFTTSYYIPTGGTGVLDIPKASNRVVSMTAGATTLIDCPEGMQQPFAVGDYVTLKRGSGCDVNWENLVNHAYVTNVNHTAGVGGYYGTRLTCDADTSGISTAFSSHDASLVLSRRVAVRTSGSAGVAYIQQVQISGDQ